MKAKRGRKALEGNEGRDNLRSKTLIPCKILRRNLSSHSLYSPNYRVEYLQL